MVEEVTPAEVQAAIEDDEDVTVVDIRSPREFARGHVPGAVNLPLRELPQRVEEFDWGEEVVCVCPIGQSSVQAARLLSSYEGIEDAKSMEGGYREWEYELEADDEDGATAGGAEDADAPF